jgi:hypothetical protein
MRWLLLAIGIFGLAGAAFPDVPPWHWAYGAVRADRRLGLLRGYPTGAAEAIENAITQVYAGFAHADTEAAQTWIERFTYDRPPSWPAPLRRTALVSYRLSGIRMRDSLASFVARIHLRDGETFTDRLHVRVKRNGREWQVDYADLARESRLFR